MVESEVVDVDGAGTVTVDSAVVSAVVTGVASLVVHVCAEGGTGAKATLVPDGRLGTPARTVTLGL